MITLNFSCIIWRRKNPNQLTPEMQIQIYSGSKITTLKIRPNKTKKSKRWFEGCHFWFSSSSQTPWGKIKSIRLNHGWKWTRILMDFLTTLASSSTILSTTLSQSHWAWRRFSVSTFLKNLIRESWLSKIWLSFWPAPKFMPENGQRLISSLFCWTFSNQANFSTKIRG